jgi:hypothetical protein
MFPAVDKRRGEGGEAGAVETDLRPRKNSNRLRHPSILASNAPWTSKSSINCSTVAFLSISTKSYAGPSSARACFSAARHSAARSAGSIFSSVEQGSRGRQKSVDGTIFAPTSFSLVRNSKRFKVLLAPDQAGDGSYDIVLKCSVGFEFNNQIFMQFFESCRIFAGE